MRKGFAVLLLLASSAVHGQVVVERVEPGSAAAQAGLRAQDRLEVWRSNDGGGTLRDRAAFQRMLWAEGARGTVRLIGRRGKISKHWNLAPGRVGLTLVEDESSDPLFMHWQRADRFEAAEQRVEALSEIERALSLLDAEQDPLTYAEFATRAGMLARRLSQLDLAEQYQERAEALRREHAPGSHVLAETLRERHLCAFARGDLELATSTIEEAIAMFAAKGSSSFDLALSRNNLGRVQMLQGDHDAARSNMQAALDELTRLDAEPLDRSRALSNLGILERRSGNLAEAQRLFEESLAINLQVDPQGGNAAMMYNNLGAVAFDRGDLLAAEQYIERALALREAAEPGTPSIALFLSNLGGMTLERGNLAKAELLLLRALEIRRKLAPGSLDEAATLATLSAVYAARGELQRARETMEEALEIAQKNAPGGADEAERRHNVAQLAVRQGDLDTAQKQLQIALKLRAQLAPRGPAHASTMAALANVERLRGEYEAAREHMEEVLAIDVALGAGGVDHASHLLTHAQTLTGLGRHEEAIAAAQQAQAMRAVHMPGTHWEAEAWQRVARAQHAAGALQPALASIFRAREILDLGGTHRALSARGRMGYRARLSDIYGDCVQWQVEAGQLDGALADLERARARVFLEMVGERDLDFEADLPDELRAERRRLRTEIDRLLKQQLAGKEVAAEAMERLAARSEQIELEIRSRAPELAQLENPHTLDAGALREELPQGTLLLSFLVGETQTLLFAVDRERASVHPIAIARDELAHTVQEFRDRIAARRAVEAQAQQLYELLLAPARERIARADRLLISPDRALHLLPFAALRDGERYLVESKPLHFVDSASVYALLRARPQGDTQAVVVFADPELPGASMQLAYADEPLRDRGLAALKHARAEAQSIAELFAPAPVELLLSDAASEARAKSLDGDFALVHFATHGLADAGLGASLVLSPGGAQDNGLLQAAEILESTRLRADLVTLSACDTALGEDFAGEGLLGLVRAFEHAGARAVVASLWAVSDEATSRLMADFYAGLRAGQDKDAALRAAQLDLFQSPAGSPSSGSRGVGALGDGATEASHPFYWAAFQLFGDPVRSVLANGSRGR